jgi:hypothetical protein
MKYMKEVGLLTLMVSTLFGPLAQAQPVPDARNITGVWAPYRAPRGSDPKLSPPPASPIVLKGEYAKAYEERRAAEAEASKRGEPLATLGSQCVPYGMPTMMSVASYPAEILQTAGQVTIITEAFSEVRRVYLDKPQEKIEDVAPGYYGRSVGKWEGDTLVIDTIAIKTSVAGYRGIPHSDQMRITERIRKITPDVLHNQITIEDPVTLEKPMTYTLAYQRLPGYEMVEFVCENNRGYVDEKGSLRIKLRDR